MSNSSPSAYLTLIKNSVAVDCGYEAITGDQISDSRGESAGTGSGILANKTAQNCYGRSNNTLGLPGIAGLVADTAQNCCGYCTGGTGLSARTAQNCDGSSNTGMGLSADNAQSCYGSSTDSGTGLYASDTAIGCRGDSKSGTGLSAYIANSCRRTSGSGTPQSITYKYNMP